MATSRWAGGSAVTSRAPIQRRPASGDSSPASRRSSVVLPQPDGPRSTRHSPGSTVRSISRSAACAPNRLPTRSKRTRMGMGFYASGSLRLYCLPAMAPATPLLEDVSLSMAAGEVHAVAGENGAGKSTLMAILSGALTAEEGVILWEGRPASLPDVRAAQALGISMVHQEPQLVPSLGVAENICLGRLPHRLGPARVVDRPALRAAARAALDALRVDVPLSAAVREIGVAQRQLVAIARALHFGARLIILDEPTSSLSLDEVEALFATLRRLRTGGTALVYISHRLEELAQVADRVTVLRDGRVVATAPMAEMTQGALIAAMSGR